MTITIRSDYEGWTNKATWLFPLWMDNDSVSYDQRIELAQRLATEANNLEAWETAHTQAWASIGDMIASDDNLLQVVKASSGSLQSDLAGWAYCYIDEIEELESLLPWFNSDFSQDGIGEMIDQHYDPAKAIRILVRWAVSQIDWESITSHWIEEVAELYCSVCHDRLEDNGSCEWCEGESQEIDSFVTGLLASGNDSLLLEEGK